MFCIYVLQSLKNGEIYIGFTTNIKNRLSGHNRGLNFSTKNGKPWKLICLEVCLNKNDAKRREKYFKTSQGRRLLKTQA